MRLSFVSIFISAFLNVFSQAPSDFSFATTPSYGTFLGTVQIDGFNADQADWIAAFDETEYVLAPHKFRFMKINLLLCLPSMVTTQQQRLTTECRAMRPLHWFCLILLKISTTPINQPKTLSFSKIGKTQMVG